MARGVLSGAIWGTLLSVGALGTLSVLETSEAERREALAEAIRALPDEETPPAEAATDTSDTDAETTADAAPAGAPAPVIAEPAGAPETPEPVPTDPQPTEETAEETATAPAPEMVEENTPEDAPVRAPEITAQTNTEAAVEPETSSDPAEPPADVDTIAVVTETPALGAPEAGTDAMPEDIAQAPTPAPETGDTVAALTAPNPADETGLRTRPSTSQTDSRAADAPALDAPEDEVGLSVSTDPAQPPNMAEMPEAPSQAADAEAQGNIGNDIATNDPSGGDAQSERPPVRQLIPATPSLEPGDGPDDVDTAALARPSIGKPASSLVDRDGTAASRLPTVGETEEGSAASVEAAQTEDTRPPLERYAAEVADTDETLPRMSIVLIDDGTGPLGPDTLDTFPFPVTFAIDPASQGAADRMRAYRALGYEVATLADLPQGAQPTDVEQLLAGAVAAVPESVALIEAPDGALQSGRDSTEQVTRFVADSGHGLVFLPNGLNTAEAIARRENVPAISVLRDFDGDGQDARTKRRFLDGAAFRARQDGSAVMLGRLTADTVSALLLWSLQDRASSVSMVPVSAILLQSIEN